MNPPAPAERRQHPRYLTRTGVSFHHEPSRRDFAARCLNGSDGGLLLSIPAAAPVQAGQSVRLASDRSPPAPPPLSGGPRRATIVRVDRTGLIREGRLAVGVRFD